MARRPKRHGPDYLEAPRQNWSVGRNAGRSQFCRSLEMSMKSLPELLSAYTFMKHTPNYSKLWLPSQPKYILQDSAILTANHSASLPRPSIQSPANGASEFMPVATMAAMATMVTMVMRMIMAGLEKRQRLRKTQVKLNFYHHIHQQQSYSTNFT